MLNDNDREVLTDEILNKAFNDYFDRVLAESPSDELLSKRYPYPESSLEKARLAYKSSKRRTSIWFSTLGRAAVIFLIAVTLTFGVLMTNSDIRAAVGDFFIRDKSSHLSINFRNEEEKKHSQKEAVEKQDEEVDFGFEITYLPDRYTLESKKCTDKSNTYYYKNPKGHTIYISIMPKKSSLINIYNEDISHELIMINGREAIYSYNTEEQTENLIVGYDDEYVIHIMTEKTVDEVVNIAKGIIRFK